MVVIRESKKSDKELISQLHLEAFGEDEGESVSKLVVELLEDESALPLLSLVAENNNKIIGHIIFSSVTVEGSATNSAYILCPLAVLDDWQRSGVGAALINHGLSTLKEWDAEFVLVLGDPNYYSRTGFKAGHGIKPPYPISYPEAWMALELKTGVLQNIKGTVQCAASLSSPEYW